MIKRVFSIILVIAMVLQFIAPHAIIAKEDVKLPKEKYVKFGVINAKSYDAKLINELNKIAEKNKAAKSTAPRFSLLGRGPYFGDKNEPKDANKPKYYGNISVDFNLSGLDGNKFQWNEIFGVDEQGKPKPAQIIFTQSDHETGDETGVEYILKVTKTGKYTWSDKNGNPTKLPLFSKKLKPYNYEVRVDEDVAENIKLLTARMTGTEGSSPTFSPENADGEIIANITLELGLQQVASTKFKSEWKTGVAEDQRPQIQGTFEEKEPEFYDEPVVFDLPKNNKDVKIIRDWEDAFEGGLIIADALYKTPNVNVKTNTAGLTFDTTKKTVKSGDHKFKYDFTYDVIKGGKLTMTEIIPVTFDANGGKFKNFTAPDTDKKIVKEVEYGKDLTDMPVGISKYRETFKGWGIKNGQNELVSVTDAAFKDIKESKTFYAMWDNNEIKVDELEVKESFAKGTEYVNDFLPTLDQLRAVVKIKDGSGTPQDLETNDKLEILGDDGNPVAEANLKNYLYEKLKEDPNTGVYKNVTLKAQVTPQNGTPQKVDIKIRVIKNIYEAKTKAGKENFVPDNYVKVTVDPTTKAKDPQKYTYYVNPDAKVVIPGKDPVGDRDNKFVKWTIPGTPDPVEYKLADKPRHQFKTETTITAQYVSDVIPQAGTTKPDHVPEGFVEVKFVATDKATDASKEDQIFWVNPEKEVTIPVKNPVGKQYFTFKEWKIGDVKTGETYTVGKAKKFEQATTITATYTEAKNIIPFDPTNLDDPKVVRPDGYIKVTFEAETGLKLTQNKAYYVKQNAKDDQGKPLTLGNAEIVKPGVKAEIGYEVKLDEHNNQVWKPADTTTIGTADIVVKVKAKPIPDTIEKIDENTKKPEGYVEVKFVAGENGKLKDGETVITEKVYYVNPTKYVTLTPPTSLAKGNTGFEFGSWSPDATIPTVYKDPVSTITANFNELKSVIPKTKDDESEKPDGYVTVTFEIEGQGGLIAQGETKTYFVKPNTDVTVPQPKTAADTGYEFDKWKIEDQEFPTGAKKYTKDTTVKGNFKKLEDIIPEKTGDTPNAKPNGYVTVTFDKGDHGSKIEGQTVYYVNPEANPTITLGNDKIKKPTIKAETGWKQKAAPNAWDYIDTKAIQSDITVTAQYDPMDDVIPKTNDDGSENEKPEGYVEVKFVAGANGTLTENNKVIADKIYFVNPNKYVKLTAPTALAKGNTGYVFSTWDKDISNYNKFTEIVTTISASFVPKDAVVPKTTNDDSEKPAGFVTVTFEIDQQSAGQGTLVGTTTYYVDPKQDVALKPPTTNPKVGYAFEKWSRDTTTKNKYSSNTTITGTFKKLGDVIPGDKTKPEGYVTVTFKANTNGKISGTTVYYVNPNVNVDLTNKAGDSISKTPNLGYTEVGGTWSNKDNKNLNDTFNSDTEFVFNFVALKDVIPAGPGVEQPKGYVKVEFIAGENGSLEGGNKTYYVNPEKDVTVGSTDLPIPEKKPDKNYKFDNWYEAINKDEVIKNDKKFVARFILDKVTMTYKADDKTSGDVPETLSYDIGTEITLAGGVNLKKDNYVLVAWSICDKSYLPGAKYKIEQDTVATAVWEAGLHTVNFDTDGGTHIDSQQVKHGEKISPVENPEKAGHAFMGWKIKGKDKYFDPTKDVVNEDLTLVAQYSSDVIPANDDGSKPEGTPDNFVKVTFVPTDKAKDTAEKIFWVNPEKEVTIPVDNPVANPGFMFKEWKIGDVTTGETYKVGTPKIFTDKNGTTITATYNESENIKPFDPKDKDPMVRPEGYVRVTFDADLGLKLTESKAYYVKKNAGVKLSQLTKPTYDKAKGYDFDKWDKDDTFEIKGEDIVVTAKAKLLPEPECKGGGVVYVPSIAPKDSGKRGDVDKSAKYLEVKYMQGHDNMFMPYKSLSRAEAAQILANALISDGYKYLDIDANTYYSDLKPNAWYLKAVSIVTQAGVFEGFDGKFMPDRSITQGEWIATLVRFQMQGKMKGNAMRVNERHWAKEEVQSAYSVGWLKIYTDGTMPFNVDKAITREEVAAVTNRAFNRVRDFEYELKNENRLYNFKDISRDMWSYYDILCATNTFVHNKKNYLSHEIDYRKYTADYKYEDLIVDHFQRVLRQKNN